MSAPPGSGMVSSRRIRHHRCVLGCRAFGSAVALMLLVGCEQIVGITDLSVHEPASSTPPVEDAGEGDAVDADTSDLDAWSDPMDATDASTTPPPDADAGPSACEKLEACCPKVSLVNRKSCNDAVISRNESLCDFTYASLSCH